MADGEMGRWGDGEIFIKGNYPDMIQHPTSNLQPPTSNLQPPTFNLQPATFNLQPSTFNL
ncbi:MAG: hypothetical protein F6K56_03305 [Moorea sp. SIO3G5]|nr:hypothetical protein [Moorena sp. SIO3G5]